MISIVYMVSACNSMTSPPPTSTAPPTSTNTAIPTNTDTPLPPSETPQPTPTIPTDIWLDTREFDLTIEHPQDPDQQEWHSIGEIIVPVDGYVGGIVFTVDERTYVWGPATSLSVSSGSSVMNSGSSRDFPTGTYCVADYFTSYNPDSACDLLAPGSIHKRWVTPYFAGYKSEVGIAFSIGSCSPKKCTVILKISGIKLIMYESPEG